MNILHFSTSDLVGGAAKSAHRLHRALQRAGHGSRMIVRDKISDDPFVHAAQKRKLVMLMRRAVGRLVPGFRWCSHSEYNADLSPTVRLPEELLARGDAVDILCLHWITGLLSARVINQLAARFRCPIVWMLTDEEPYTGGCHYSYDCAGYAKECGHCPQLKPAFAWDRSRVVWRHKSRYLAQLPITFVPSCTWTAEKLNASSLFGRHRSENIGDALDTAVYHPIEKAQARAHWQIPTSAKVVFFGAASLADHRKGMTYLAEALARLAGGAWAGDQSLFLLCAGRRPDALLNSLPFPNRWLGYLKDEASLALAYQAADIFVCPSVYEAGAMMIPEAMLCGTPVVAFDTGNVPDLIRHMETGYRAAYKDSADLANGMSTLLASPQLQKMGEAACGVARARHAPDIVAAQHLALYQALLAEQRAPGSTGAKQIICPS